MVVAIRSVLELVAGLVLAKVEEEGLLLVLVVAVAREDVRDSRISVAVMFAGVGMFLDAGRVQL